MQPPPGLQPDQDWTSVSLLPAPIGIDLPPTSTIDLVIATAISAAAAASSSALSASTSYHDNHSDDDDDDSKGECRLLGPFALLVQAALGGLALLSLVYKRWRERPQRPVKIWFFDVSKQVFGSVLVHIANIFMSMLTSGRFSIDLDKGTTSASAAIVTAAARRMLARDDADVYEPNPCSFYLLNLAIDTTIGIPILIILLRITTALVSYTPLGKPVESIQSGHYGSPPNVWWWLKQSVIYFFGLFGMKICVLIIFLMIPVISKIGDWALGWTEGNEKLQIAFVMMIFPLIMNGLQYYIIDSFIKGQNPEDHERVSSEDPDERRRIFDAGDAHDGSDEDTDVEDHHPENRKFRGHKVTIADEYNPAVDGHGDNEGPTSAAASSSSRQNEAVKVASPGLYPKE